MYVCIFVEINLVARGLYVVFTLFLIVKNSFRWELYRYSLGGATSLSHVSSVLPSFNKFLRSSIYRYNNNFCLYRIIIMVNTVASI